MKASKIAILCHFSCRLYSSVFLFLPIREWFMQFESYVQSLGAIGPVVVVLAYMLCTVLFIPGSALTIGSGTLFGLSTGFIVVILGANLGALVLISPGANFVARKSRELGVRQSKIPLPRSGHRQAGIQDGLLTRLSPVFPFVLLNYFLGLTAVRTASYVLANLIGMLPATFLFVYIGAAARDALPGPVDASADFYQQIFKYVGLLATVAVVVVVTRVARKALREAEEQEEGIRLVSRVSIRTTSRRPTIK